MNRLLTDDSHGMSRLISLETHTHTHTHTHTVSSALVLLALYGLNMLIEKMIKNHKTAKVTKRPGL